MSTLAQIAEGFGLHPADLATMVGMRDTNPYAALSPEQVAFVLEVADNHAFLVDPSSGRHSRRARRHSRPDDHH